MRLRAQGTRSTPTTYALLVVLAGLYSWIAATTKPFTTDADAIVAVGYVLVSILLINRLRRQNAARRRPSGSRKRTNLWPWALAITFLVTVELVSYFGGWVAGRHAFPTLSSLYDRASGSSAAAKAAVVFLWMALGWGLFRSRPVDDELAEFPAGKQL